MTKVRLRHYHASRCVTVEHAGIPVNGNASFLENSCPLGAFETDAVDTRESGRDEADAMAHGLRDYRYRRGLERGKV